MTDLTYAGGNNPAGHFHLRCVPASGVISLPTPAAGGPMEVSGAPTFASGFGWIDLYGTDGTKSYSEEEEETDNGPVWTMGISLFLPGDSSVQRQTLYAMSRQRFILSCQDNMGVWRLLGTKRENMTLKYKFGIGPQVGDTRGAVLTFSGSLTAPPPLITGQ